jgi:hypothetical protein
MEGVTVLQFLERVPDREAVELLRYHAGWNFALNRQLGDPVGLCAGKPEFGPLRNWKGF